MSGVDVRDILDIPTPEASYVTKEAIIGDKKKKVIKKLEKGVRRPEGMHRELWGLLWTDDKDAHPVMPTDTNQGYKQMKAKIGRSRVRPWKWMSFTNPARKDGAAFHHWRRIADEGKDYPFSKFNKAVDITLYSDIEYQQHLHSDLWTRAETDYLFELCRQFDLRFIVVHDRWDCTKYQSRTVEDLKDRYYTISNTLTKIRATGHEPKVRTYDVEHERKRKDQLIKLFNRTNEEIEEEEHLIHELKKIELRKREREKKTQDLQKLITAADTNMESRKTDKKNIIKKKVPLPHKTRENLGTTPDTGGIKFPDQKLSGISLRSQRMKLPASVGQKKTKAIEQVLDELSIDLNPVPTEEIVLNFNELRQDIVLLYELKLAQTNCEYELQTLRHRHEVLAPGKPLDQVHVAPESGAGDSLASTAINPDILDSPSKSRKLSETIDVVGVPGMPMMKRKAALEQVNVIKKVKGQRI